MQEAVPQARGPDKGKRKRQEEDHSRTMEILYLCAFGLTYMDSPVGESLAPWTVLIKSDLITVLIFFLEHFCLY